MILATQGYEPTRDVRPFINRTGATVAAGQVVQVDVGQDAAESNNNITGLKDSGYRSVVLPQSDQLKFGTFGVVQAPAVNGAETMVLLEGYTTVTIVHAVSGTVPPGTPLVAVAADSSLDADLANGEKVIARVRESVSAVDATGKTAEVEFSGLRGFGNYLA